MIWKRGDHALIVNSLIPQFNELECVIVSPYRKQFNRDGSGYIMGWEVVILEHPNKTYGAGSNNLVPIIDNNEKSNWEAIADIWQPKDLKVPLCVTK